MNKYGVGNKHERVYNGCTYRSKAEAAYAKLLDLRLRTVKASGSILRWWYEPKMGLWVNGVLVGHYSPDFQLDFHDGLVEYHEVKGVMTEAASLRIRLFRACYPAAVLRIIDPSTLAEKLPKRRKQTGAPEKPGAPAGRPSRRTDR